MVVHKALDVEHACVPELLSRVRVNSLDLLQVIDLDILISYAGEYISGQFIALVADGMDEMAEVTPCASIWSMVIPARYSAVIAWLDNLIGV